MARTTRALASWLLLCALGGCGDTESTPARPDPPPAESATTPTSPSPTAPSATPAATEPTPTPTAPVLAPGTLPPAGATPSAPTDRFSHDEVGRATWDGLCVDGARLWDNPDQLVDPRFLQDLVCGRRNVSDFMDPARGVIVIQAVESGDDEGETEQTARRVCGTELTGLETAVLDDLNLMLLNHLDGIETNSGARAEGEPEEPALLIHCVALHCRMSGQTEYDPDIQLVFELDAARGVVLTEVERIERLMVDDAVVRERDAWALAERTRLAATPCTP